MKYASNHQMCQTLQRAATAADDATVVKHLVEALRQTCVWPTEVRDLQFVQEVTSHRHEVQVGGTEYSFEIPDLAAKLVGHKLFLAVQVDVGDERVRDVLLKSESGEFRRPMKCQDIGVLGEVK